MHPRENICLKEETTEMHILHVSTQKSGNAKLKAAQTDSLVCLIIIYLTVTSLNDFSVNTVDCQTIFPSAAFYRYVESPASV